MKVIERSALVPYSSAQMFALVSDVAGYPKFLPWCSGASVREAAPNERVATVKVSRGMLKTEFTTRNISRPDAEIMMHLVDGPFRRLVGEWRFEPIGGGEAAVSGSRVSFRVEFEFKNSLTAAAFNAVFEALCGTIVDAFVERARQLYS